MERNRMLLDSDSIAVPAPIVSRTSGTYGSGEDSFDNNMVIILAALLCALICALGLNSIVRCAMRCSQRFAFETPEQSATRLASKGLNKEALNRIPIVVYKSEMKFSDCPICLGEFSGGVKVKILPNCNHGFHGKCIDTWLGSHSSCPVCRQLLFEHSIKMEGV